GLAEHDVGRPSRVVPDAGCRDWRADDQLCPSPGRGDRVRRVRRVGGAAGAGGPARDLPHHPAADVGALDPGDPHTRHRDLAHYPCLPSCGGGRRDSLQEAGIMTEGEQEPKKIVVPGSGGYDDDDGEVLVRPEDIESTSRSCLAIIVILI